jgi:hypothetical protein
MVGTQAVYSQLNLNYRTLNIDGAGGGFLVFDWCTLTTAINYDLGLMGNITVPKSPVFFLDQNTMAVGIIAGTPKTFSKPLLTTLNLGGQDFNVYNNFAPNNLNHTTAGGTITISHP